MQTAHRLEGIGEYYFSQKLREIEGLNREGKNVINLGIGSPDLPPDPAVVEVLHQWALKPNTHAYQSYRGSAALRKAIAHWYQGSYRVNLNPEEEILPLIGSKEGIMHICMTYINPGDAVLVPNPGYPTYAAAARLAGGNPVFYRLTHPNDWIPDFQELERLLRTHRVGKPEGWNLMFVNYPHMPTGRLPDRALFEQLVAFASNNRVLLVHDNPYSFILNDHPMSILETDGAMEVALELNSLSKSHNMAGWRVGMLLGNKIRLDQVMRFKSNMDSGMFLPLQMAAARALELPATWYQELNKVYRVRRQWVFRILNFLGCEFDASQAGMFVWAKVPSQYPSGFQLSDRVLNDARVFITPGGIFGDEGESFVRVSLCNTEEKLEEALVRISTAMNKL